MMKDRSVLHPDRIPSYFRAEWLPLTFVTLSGLLYNVGLLAAPWFEGKLAQCLADILSGNAAAAQMAVLVLAYLAVTLTVQAALSRVTPAKAGLSPSGSARTTEPSELLKEDRSRISTPLAMARRTDSACST